MPVHNEQELLKYSLPSIYKLNPIEILIILDRCTDNSSLVIEIISKKFDRFDQTKIIDVNNTSPSWVERNAYLRRLGFSYSNNEIILNTDADLVLDINIKDHIQKLSKPKLGLLGFGFIDYPYNIQSFSRRIITKFTPFSGYAGLYAFKKTAWQKTENMEDLKKNPSSEDAHLRLAISSKYHTEHVNTNTLHLRPTESQERSYLRGAMYWKLLRYPLWKMILYSMVTFRPAALKGYLESKDIKNNTIS
jgi:glycosyltransferase involved in cell wall biosynthesis